MYKKIDACRICGNTHLESILDLGEQVLTGVFPSKKNQQITKGPLRLVKCFGDVDVVCGLVQLEHSYDPDEMYSDNYGYRSGLNASMVTHLNGLVKSVLKKVKLKKGDLILDIGSNDSTTLQAYPADQGLNLLGIDPTGVKFKEYYPDHIQLIPDFFSQALVEEKFGLQKAKVVTSMSMFYDLEDPMSFMREVYNILDEYGIWVFEQSYLPTMLEMNSYDTVCHEHLEYYALKQIKWMTDKIGFTILDVEFNDVNGGSFQITAQKSSQEQPVADIVNEILAIEKELNLDTLQPFKQFAQRVDDSRNQLLAFLAEAKRNNKKVAALGASTKGNVVLQYCGLTEDDLIHVGEVNAEKYGCYTPGTKIPIITESEAVAANSDYLLILPWHFKKHFLKNENLYGCSLVVPLPNVLILS